MSRSTKQKEKQKIPELRFPGFVNAWHEKKLEEIAAIIGGGTPDTTKAGFWKEEINWFTPTEIKQKYVIDSSRKISKLGLENSSAVLLPIGTVLFTSRATVGDVSISKKESATNQGFQSFVVNKKNSNQFLYYWILQNRKEFLRKANGSTFLEISGKEIRKIKSFFPDFGEQHKIADFLESVDVWIENLKTQKIFWEKYKKGLAQKIFSQEIRFKDEKKKDFPKWEEKKLKDLVSFSRGSSLSKSDLKINGKYKCIHYGELFTEYSEIISSIKSKTDLDTGVDGKIGDILMPTSDVTPEGLAKASSLQVGIVKLGGDINILRPNSRVNSILLCYLLNFEKKKIMRIVSGTTVRHVYNKDLGKLKYFFSLNDAEQLKIADFLTSIDKLIKSKQHQITQAEQWKKGLMQKMFV
jgi:type I restriction enzyme S subunit